MYTLKKSGCFSKMEVQISFMHVTKRNVISIYKLFETCDLLYKLVEKGLVYT